MTTWLFQVFTLVDDGKTNTKKVEEEQEGLFVSKNEAKRKKNKRIKSNVCNTKFTNDVNSTCYLIFIQYLEKSYCYTNQGMKND